MRVMRGLWPVLLLCLAACATLPEAGRQPVKGDSDARDYRYLQLDNGLRVLLVSDPSTDLAAASLDVHAGSGNDPVQRPGLAHFLEHMLFLGTAKYPEPDSYQRFIKDNAGSHNAYTSFEHTNYFFSVRPQALDEALDRFADFFIHPLLDEQYVEREKNAVESEYQARMKDELRRQLDVVRQLMNPDHPFSRFSIGSLETLSSSEQPIRDDLLAFYRRYYVAGNMTLAVLGSQSLDQLEAQVRQRFSAIAGDGVVSAPQYDMPAFADGSLPQQVFIQPEQQLQELTLLFPVADMQRYYSAKPAQLLGHVLGHEGEGSLLSYLKAQGLASGLAAGLSWQYNGGAAFSIRITLTDSGLSRSEDVAEMVFQAIENLRSNGIPAWVFDDLAAIATLEFHYAEPDSPLGHVMRLANNLHSYPVRDVMQGDYLYRDFRPQLVRDLLGQLTVNNLLLIRTGEQFNATASSPYHFTPYHAEQLPARLRTRLMDAVSLSAIGPPAKNPFLPERLVLLEPAASVPVPSLVVERDGEELWFKPLQRFRLPKAVNYFSLIRPDMGESARTAALLELYVAMLADSLNEWLYPAAMAGLEFQLYPHARGLTLKIGGFYDRQDELLARLVADIRDIQFSPQQFARVHEQQLREWHNADKIPPYQKALAALSVAMRPGVFSVAERLQAAQALTLDDVEAFAQAFWQSGYLRSLANGNMPQEQAERMHGLFAALRTEALAQPAPLQARKLDVAQQQIIDSRHSDAAYVLYWQAADNSLAGQAQWMMLGQALEADFFHQMRTEKQLGYAVFARYYPLFTVPGMVFVLQSPVADGVQLHGHVDDYLDHALQQLQQLPEEVFEQYRSSLIQSLAEEDKTLEQESDRYWYQLALGDRDFSLRAQQLAAVQALTLVEWQAFVAQLAPGLRRYVLTTGKQPLDGFVPATAVQEQAESYRYH